MMRMWAIPAITVLLGAALIVFKICDVIASPWWLVCAPFGVMAAAIVWAAATLPMPKKSRVLCVNRQTANILLASPAWRKFYLKRQ